MHTSNPKKKKKSEAQTYLCSVYRKIKFLNPLSVQRSLALHNRDMRQA